MHTPNIQRNARFRILRVEEIETFYDQLDESVRDLDHDNDDLWDDPDPIIPRVSKVLLD